MYTKRVRKGLCLQNRHRPFRTFILCYAARRRPSCAGIPRQGCRAGSAGQHFPPQSPAPARLPCASSITADCVGTHTRFCTSGGKMPSSSRTYPCVQKRLHSRSSYVPKCCKRIRPGLSCAISRAEFSIYVLCSVGETNSTSTGSIFACSSSSSVSPGS